MKTLFNLTSLMMFMIVGCCFFMHPLYAQSQKAIININDKSLEQKMEEQLTALRMEKGFDIEKLRANLKDLKSTDQVTAQLPVPRNTVLTGAAVYEKCRTGTLIVGRNYNCGNCSKVHSIYASGAILTADGLCITNHHVLEELIENNSERDSAYFVGTIDGKVFPIVDVLCYSKDADLAIFRIDPLGSVLQPIPLGLSAPTGSTVYALTNPTSNFFFFSTGIVARNISYQIDNPLLNRVDITADYAKGSSGGPILDQYGNLIGIVTTTRSVYYEDEQQKNLQMVFKNIIPVSSIKMMFTTPI